MLPGPPRLGGEEMGLMERTGWGADVCKRQ